MGEGQLKIDRIPVGFLGTNCYLISDDNKRTAVIDPGDEAGTILEFAERNGLLLDTILITHGHFDHVGGVTEIINKTGAKLAISGIDEASVAKDVDIDVKDGTVINVGDLTFLAIATPGHSPGGICYRIGTVLFSGDTLFFESVGRTDLPGGDYQKLQRSLETILGLSGIERVLPGHMQETTLEHERENNIFIR